MDRLEGARSCKETTRESFAALALATTGRNCVAAAVVILANFRRRAHCKQAQKKVEAAFLPLFLSGRRLGSRVVLLTCRRPALLATP
jgi:hypothetical protein